MSRRGSGMRPCDLIAQVHGWFTEGLETLDLKAAKALLGDLAAKTALKVKR